MRGALWMAAAAFLFALVYVTIRRLAETLSIFELVFLRALLGLIFMAPWLMRAGVVALRTTRGGLYGLRVLFAYSGMVCWFYGLANMPLADATSLMFTMPLFAVLLAALALGERVGIHRWGATVVGFAGALVIVRPGIIEVGLATVAVLYTAVAYGAGNIVTKALTRTDSSNAVVFYHFVLMTLVSAVPAALVWRTPTLAELPWILGFGVLSALAQQCVTRSYAAAPASVVTPFNYLKLPFVAAVAFLWIGETPDPWTWLGAAVIFASTWFTAHREARQSRAEARLKPASHPDPA